MISYPNALIISLVIIAVTLLLSIWHSLSIYSYYKKFPKTGFAITTLLAILLVTARQVIMTNTSKTVDEKTYTVVRVLKKTTQYDYLLTLTNEDGTTLTVSNTQHKEIYKSLASVYNTSSSDTIDVNEGDTIVVRYITEKWPTYNGLFKSYTTHSVETYIGDNAN